MSELSWTSAEWVEEIIAFAAGKPWDTGEIWVCECHPWLPFGNSHHDDCHLCEGGPGMPPSTHSLSMLARALGEEVRKQSVELTQLRQLAEIGRNMVRTHAAVRRGRLDDADSPYKEAISGAAAFLSFHPDFDQED
jgi:hypothetical protein